MSTPSPARLPHDEAARLCAAHHFGLAVLGRKLASLGGLEVSLLAGCDGDAMLLVEGADHDGQPATWLVTSTPGHPMVLEAVIDETRLDLLAIAPRNRILTLLAALAGRVRVDA